MAAIPADIAEFTTDGVLLSAPVLKTDADAIKAAYVDARDGTTDEIEMFYDDPADGQYYLLERFAILSLVNPLKMALEVEESLGLGTTIPITPAVPAFSIVDDRIGLSQAVRVRSYAADLGTDRFAIEVEQ